ncbi:MAG: hypothetical protein KME20_20100 [Kaiparowitsia implicata GSE-PSE-MK54-09C]|jgi:hypothetical protein|nr:hypothetical protein [Kaiparowitsia implicata GSE-PSE-MK54-09C]
MWQRIINLIPSLEAYGLLSPDLAMRRRVNRLLGDRPVLSLDTWYERHCAPSCIAFAVAEFVYQKLPDYSGVDIGRVVPSDRLEDDLCWTDICWFDWYLALCDDFGDRFDISLSPYLEELDLETVQDLLLYLNDQFQRHTPNSVVHS